MSERVGHYILGEILSRGGETTVHRATHELLPGHPFAIKRPAIELLNDTSALRRFERAGGLLAGMGRTPGIVRTLPPLFDGGMWVHPMEALPIGRTLAKIIAGAAVPMDISRAVHIGLEVARAVARLNNLAAVTPKLQPDHVWIGDDGSVTLIGLSGLLLMDDPAFPPAAGSDPLYIPPEALENRPLDYTSDVFRIGAMLYRMLAGRVYFESPVGAPAAVAASMRVYLAKGGRPRPSDHRQGISPALDELVAACLMPQPSDRPPYAHALAEALQEVEAEYAPPPPAAAAPVGIAAAVVVGTTSGSGDPKSLPSGEGAVPSGGVISLGKPDSPRPSPDPAPGPIEPPDPPSLYSLADAPALRVPVSAPSSAVEDVTVAPTLPPRPLPQVAVDTHPRSFAKADQAARAAAPTGVAGTPAGTPAASLHQGSEAPKAEGSMAMRQSTEGRRSGVNATPSIAQSMGLALPDHAPTPPAFRSNPAKAASGPTLDPTAPSTSLPPSRPTPKGFAIHDATPAPAGPVSASGRAAAAFVPPLGPSLGAKLASGADGGGGMGSGGSTSASSPGSAKVGAAAGTVVSTVLPLKSTPKAAQPLRKGASGSDGIGTGAPPPSSPDGSEVPALSTSSLGTLGANTPTPARGTPIGPVSVTPGPGSTPPPVSDRFAATASPGRAATSGAAVGRSSGPTFDPVSGTLDPTAAPPDPLFDSFSVPQVATLAAAATEEIATATTGTTVKSSSAIPVEAPPNLDTGMGLTEPTSTPSGAETSAETTTEASAAPPTSPESPAPEEVLAVPPPEVRVNTAPSAPVADEFIPPGLEDDHLVGLHDDWLATRRVLGLPEEENPDFATFARQLRALARAMMDICGCTRVEFVIETSRGHPVPRPIPRFR